MDNYILEMRNIEKRFQGVHALKNANLTLKKGEVHALVGENGAGKSTLMKVLTGIHQKDGGEILYQGKPVVFKNPKEAQLAGISIVHQELNLMNHLTIAQNIFIGREGKGLFVSDSALNQKAKALLTHLKLSISPNELVGNLTIGKQQMVEIAKAISFDAQVVIFDEPTAALTENEIAELFKIIEELKKKDVAMVYISHRMNEIMEITDNITVMRDGEYIGTVKTAETDLDTIINMMVGRTIFEQPKTHSTVASDAPVVLKVEHLNSDSVKDVSFEVRKGEILGFAGLMGAGRTETARLIFGADQRSSGQISVNGKEVKIKSPYDAVRAGIGYLSEDRKRFGLAVGMTITDNTIMADLDAFCTGGIINDKKAEEAAKKYVDLINIKTPSVRQKVSNLSGGNQQKVVIAKWLLRNCDILIFDEPTRGIDVGAKSEIYNLMKDLSDAGKAIIMISSELPEVLRMSDRIAVMHEGKLTKILDISEANQESIMRYATTG